ncbi:AGE family epimerase/isomerase [Fodinibius sediminis]|uniref:Mannobiose 2-epimerase n=1 Tax=Fodinibius sediminis TaxID=1214077 RepID=A0A521DHP1_9BACT|nr:AGE family epimerase/isomerase [Fodinibius sediminis]SMO71229.1 mannobiose 2-epimerase [Fodinibius sediminis]
MRLLRVLVVVILGGFVLAKCENKDSQAGPPPVQDRARTIMNEIDSVLNDQYQLWYPRVMDRQHGGYLSQFTYDWKPEGDQDKFIVTQARHVWSTSKIAAADNGLTAFEDYGRHGYQFLRGGMWDQEHGGFYELVSREGEVIAEGDTVRKQLYGNAFGIYGLAAYYQVSKDPEVLDLAREAFRWLDEGAYDPENGGYFNSLTREGKPYSEGFPKDYNSSIHILEALAELYQVWPDALLRERLHEMYRIVRDRMVTDKGYLNLNFRADWSPVVYTDSSRALQKAHLDTDHITFGHDIETAFLLLEAAHALGFPADSTLSKAKQMVDHTVEHAWDEEEGGIYDYGYYFQGDDSLTVTSKAKVWWSQVEALHSLLIMARYFPDDPHNYFDLFARQWAYIKQYMLDREHGGWYRSGLDEEPEARKTPKATIWKGNYHTIRGLLRSKELLKAMAQNESSE